MFDPNLDREKFIKEVAIILFDIYNHYNYEYVPSYDDTEEDIEEYSDYHPAPLVVTELLCLLDPQDENDNSAIVDGKALHMRVLDEWNRLLKNAEDDLETIERLKNLSNPKDPN